MASDWSEVGRGVLGMVPPALISICLSVDDEGLGKPFGREKGAADAMPARAATTRVERIFSGLRGVKG